MTFAARDSLISTDSNTTYPSTLSSYGPSALGLTDSPSQLRDLRAAHGKTSSPLAADNVARIPRVGSKTRLRSVPSNPSLPIVTENPSSGTGNAQPPTISNGDAKAARLNSFVAEARRAAAPQAGTEQSRLANRPVQAKRSQSSLAPPNPAPGAARATTAPPRPRPTANGSSPAIAIPVRPTTAPRQGAVARPPASPARTETTMAEEWEAELVRDAKKLQLQPRPRSRPSNKNLKNVQEDVEWERSGMWEAQKDVARQAEDRTRREASREIGKRLDAALLTRSLPTRHAPYPYPCCSIWRHVGSRRSPSTDPPFARSRVASAQPAGRAARSSALFSNGPISDRPSRRRDDCTWELQPALRVVPRGKGQGGVRSVAREKGGERRRG
jgi:hypothetical protein